ncbi:MAG: response regulator, partial [Candidatus Hydrogenedentes bacterium]|nr:response regulator [Candidatus Hydrogenedentota bacterium]
LGRGQMIVGHVKDFPQSEQAVLGTLGIQSAAIVPIFVQDAWWGFAGFKDCTQEREWSREELDALVASAGILGAAIQCSQAEKTLLIVHDLSLALGSTDDINRALNLILDSVLRMEGIDCGGIYLCDRDGALDLMAHRGLTPGFVAQCTHYPPDAPHARLAREGKTVHRLYEVLSNAMDDVRANEGLRGIVVIPVMHHGELLVVLNLASHTHDSIPIGTRRALETLAQQVGSILTRLRVTAALQESQENLDTLFNTVNDFLFVLDDAGRIQEVNAFTLNRLGYSREELRGMDVLSVHPPDRRSEAAAIVVAMLAGECEFCPIPLQTKDGSLIPVETRVTAGAWGGRPALFGICRDITERVRMEQEKLAVERKMFHAQKLESLGALAGGIAHDFNNLLMVTLCNIDLALDEIPSPEPAHGFLNEALKSTQRAAAVARQMLAYSGHGQSLVKAVDLGHIVRQMSPLLLPSIAKSVTLRLHTEANLPTISADAAQLQQVVMNLTTNAAESYMGSGPGEVCVSVETRYCTQEFLSTAPSDVLAGRDNPFAEGDYICLSVKDCGCGMTEETRNRIFDPFFSTKFTGRGLGMAVVLGIVRGHRGVIHVDSQPGQGTAVSVFFPVAEGALPHQPEAGASRGQVALHGSMKVLVVDDEEPVRNVVASLLKRRGYSVLLAANGREGIRLYAEHMDSIDCVVLDLTMPDVNGDAVFREIRKMDADARVILSSGYDEDETVRRFADLDIAGFLQKPFLPQVLLNKIEAVLPSRRQSAIER